jgi:hypothetical protein
LKGVQDVVDWDTVLYLPRNRRAVWWVSAGGVSSVFKAVCRKTGLLPP